MYNKLKPHQTIMRIDREVLRLLLILKAEREMKSCSDTIRMLLGDPATLSNQSYEK